jgi:leucine-zipper-like transcriptional regulator 1
MSKNFLKSLPFFVLPIIISGAVFYFLWKQPAVLAPEQPKPPSNPATLTWQEATSSAPWQARDSYAAAVFDGKIWMMGGLDANKNVLAPNVVEYWKADYFNDIWSTPDGTNWVLNATNAPWGQRRSAEAIVFNGKMWLAGGWGPNIGLKNDVWFTQDGISWEIATDSAAWQPREGHQFVVFDNKMWIMGGVLYDSRTTLNDVWYSQDGTNWTQATSSAPWSSRWDDTVTVFNGKMWLSGGMDLKGHIFNDVWYTQDGINWNMATDAPGWTPRQGHGFIEYHGKLWLIGRFNDVINAGPNDVWYTEDGVLWTKTQTDPLWLGREDIVALNFLDKIWIFGGMNSNWQWSNDVWFSIYP